MSTTEALAIPSGVRRGFSGTVGETPLIRIESLSKATGCNILAKADHLNPGGESLFLYLLENLLLIGSVKDRAGRFERTLPMTEQKQPNIL